MNPNLPDVRGAQYRPEVLLDLVEKLTSAFRRVFAQGGEIVIGDGQRIRAHLSQTYTLNFAAPGAVPGKTDQVVALTGARLGDIVEVAAPLAVGANYSFGGFVSATDQVTLRWWQFTGAAADPDGAGGSYRVALWRH